MFPSLFQDVDIAARVAIRGNPELLSQELSPASGCVNGFVINTIIVSITNTTARTHYFIAGRRIITRVDFWD